MSKRVSERVIELKSEYVSKNVKSMKKRGKNEVKQLNKRFYVDLFMRAFQGINFILELGCSARTVLEQC